MVSVYNFSEIEIHVIGQYVSVCWNKKPVMKKIQSVEDGKFYTVPVTVRDGKPYISFVMIREKNGEVWKSEDSSVVGGITVVQAEQVACELLDAISYIKTIS